MSAVESALEVLSRAATMVQEERPKPATTNLHRKPSSAWRRERRRDPIQSEALDMSNSAVAARAQQQQQQHSSRPSVIVPVTSAAPQAAPGLHSPSSAEAADFLAGKRKERLELKPTLALTATATCNEDTAVTPTGSATPSVACRGQRTGLRLAAGLGPSDPAIDEHFKRSLGLKDYAAVFDASDKLEPAAAVAPAATAPTSRTACQGKEAGLTVDDHFAKALGETWTRLQASKPST